MLSLSLGDSSTASGNCIQRSTPGDGCFSLLAVEQPVLRATRAAPSSSSRYAISQLGGVRQVVEEGHDYSCLSTLLQEARTNNSSNSAVFHSVLGVRSEGQFTWGKPYVADAAVEVELLEEFQGPVPHTSAAVPVDSMMARYRVKQIKRCSRAASIQ